MMPNLNNHLAIALLIFGLVGTCAIAEPVQVTLQNGPVIGESLTIASRPISRFLGIPYAQPPVGRLRFRKPVPVEKWNEPLQAVNWPVGCIQFMGHPLITAVKHLLKNNATSEDCLYLNIWSPNVNAAETELLPVIVWIHGGGLFMGSSSFDVYDGEMLAAKADAVVVSINYRLATLGFMYSDEVEDVKGNQGLWDQTLALEFIQDNIKYFGGDASRVTVMGESAGSWSVSLHVVSPVSRNLFHNAIMMSGAAITDKVVVEPAKYVAQFLTGIRKVGCATEADTTISAKVIECLQELDAEKVDQIVWQIEKHPAELQPLVVVDGHFLPAKPKELLEAGNYKTDVNILVSTVQDEGTFYFAMMLPQFRARNPEPFSLEQAKNFLAEFTSNVWLHKPVPKELLSKIYYAGLTGQTEAEDVYRRRTGIAFGDLLIGCSTLQFAKEVVRNSPKTANVYQWYYSAKLGGLKMVCTEAAGTCHCDDLYPVFGAAFRQPERYLNRERDISQEVINFIGSFVRTGKPTAEHPEWEPYFVAEDQKTVIAPYYEINNDYKKPENFKFNLKQLECELIWNQYD